MAKLATPIASPSSGTYSIGTIQPIGLSITGTLDSTVTSKNNTRSPLPINTNMIYAGGEIYQIGGGASLSVESTYFDQIDSWTARRSSPERTGLAGKLHHTNGFVYIISGYFLTNHTYKYWPMYDTWALLAFTYPTPSYGIACSEYHEDIYCFGGLLVSTDSPTDYAYKLTIYNGLITNCEQIATMPYKIGFAQAETIGRYIYIMGGNLSNGSSSKTVLRYDTSLNTYTYVSSMLYERSHFASYIFYNEIWVFGGHDIYSLSTVEKYNIENDIWSNDITQLGDISYPTIYGCGTLDNKMYLSVSSNQRIIEYIPPIRTQIRYTLDGSVPTLNSLLYSTPIIIKETKTLKAISFPL